MTSARTSVERWQQRLPITGYRTLRARWPDVAEALDQALSSDSERQLIEQTRSAAPLTRSERSLEETTRDLEHAIASAPPGLTLIKAQCGLGKTQAALRVAAARAATPYASQQAQGARAPPHSKTSISVDKNNLALQCLEALREQQAPVARLFGPLSLRRDTSGGAAEPVCKLHKVALPLVQGGLRMQWELCERRGGWDKCPHYDGCEARQGWEGDDPARVTLGTHALIGQLEGVAGPSGLLVIDEPQEILETVALKAADLDLAERWADHWFDGEFVGAVMPAITCFRVYLQAGQVGEALDASEAVRRVELHVDRQQLEQAQRSAEQFDGDVIECARHARFPHQHHGTSPPVRATAIERTLSEQLEAWKLGKVAEVLGTVHRALSGDSPTSIRVKVQRDQRLLLVTAPRAAFAEAIRRDGAVVVLDANAELHAPILSKIVGYEPRVLEFEAADGAPIERTLLRTTKANRKQWFEQGHPKLAPSLLLAVQALVEWVLAAPGNGDTGIITFSQLELVLRYALGLALDDARASARGMGWPEGLLDAASARLAPLLARLPKAPLTGHYGAVRGLDSMKECDNLVTLGDPWMNLGDALNDAAFLGLGEQWDTRFEARCRAELEQAHGRLRTIHRARPGRALHIGKVLPSGRAWESGGVVVKRFEGGRPAQPSAMTAEEFSSAVERIGGIRPMARLLSKDPKTVSGYRDGRLRVPPNVAQALSEITAG